MPPPLGMRRLHGERLPSADRLFVPCEHVAGSVGAAPRPEPASPKTRQSCDVTAPPDSAPVRAAMDKRGKTCEQLLGGSTRDHSQQTMTHTHTAVSLPEPLRCPHIPRGHCGYTGLPEGHGHVVCVFACLCETKRAQQGCCQNRKSAMGCKRWGTRKGGGLI